MPVILTTTPLVGTKQGRDSFLACRRRRILVVLLLLLFPAARRDLPVPQEKEKTALGSLTSVGEVYVNDSPAPAEITILSGDRVRVGENGSATFNMSGKGSLKLSPRSQALFAGKYEYTVELEAGAGVMNFISGPNWVSLRVGKDVVVFSTEENPALAFFLMGPDWAVLCTFLDGGNGVL